MNNEKAVGQTSVCTVLFYFRDKVVHVVNNVHALQKLRLSFYVLNFVLTCGVVELFLGVYCLLYRQGPGQRYQHQRQQQQQGPHVPHPGKMLIITTGFPVCLMGFVQQGQHVP